METLPAYVRALFWEGLAEEPDPARHADYIAIRVLEAGDERAYGWLLSRYGLDRLREVAESGRLRPAHTRFWGAVLGRAP